MLVIIHCRTLHPTTTTTRPCLSLWRGNNAQHHRLNDNIRLQALNWFEWYSVRLKKYSKLYYWLYHGRAIGKGRIQDKRGIFIQQSVNEEKCNLRRMYVHVMKLINSTESSWTLLSKKNVVQITGYIVRGNVLYLTQQSSAVFLKLFHTKDHFVNKKTLADHLTPQISKNNRPAYHSNSI